MSAFPTLSLLQNRDGDYSLEQEGGLTKRELFAAMAMQGIRATLHEDRALYDDVAEMAVKQADALLAELAKETKP